MLYPSSNDAGSEARPRGTVNMMNGEYKGYIERKCELCKESDVFSPELYSRYDVKKGLRDSEGNGVIVGLTRVSQVDGS